MEFSLLSILDEHHEGAICMRHDDEVVRILTGSEQICKFQLADVLSNNFNSSKRICDFLRFVPTALLVCTKNEFVTCHKSILQD